MSHEHGGGGGESPESALQTIILCFLVSPVILQKIEETIDELTGATGGHH